MRKLVLVLFGISFLGCAPKHLPTHWYDALELRITYDQEDARAGIRMPLKCSLTNTSSQKLRVCLSNSRQYHISGPKRVAFAYWGQQDHYFCDVPIVIKAKQSHAWIEFFTLPDSVTPGNSHITLSVPIVDPGTCELLGCEHTMLESNAVAVVLSEFNNAKPANKSLQRPRFARR